VRHEFEELDCQFVVCDSKEAPVRYGLWVAVGLPQLDCGRSNDFNRAKDGLRNESSLSQAHIDVAGPT
jgi:hypothetical protein